MNKFILLILLLTSVQLNYASVVYDVTSYGAVSDTTILSTSAFQNAIDQCFLAGGGIVVVNPGDYKISTVVLKDNVQLHIMAGATIYASRNVEDYKEMKFNFGAADMKDAEAMILAISAKNISVTGKGTLHARAEREMFRRSPQHAIIDSVTSREIDNAIKYGVDY